MGWKDREYQQKDDLTVYPYIQWVNDGGSLEPRSKRGGFAAPVDQGIELEGGTKATINHKGGEETPAIFAQRLNVAILRSKLIWQKDGITLQGYEEGARGRTRALCLVKGNHGLTMLTLRGTVGKHLRNARSKFSRVVGKATKGKAPMYAFYMTLEAGEIEIVGKGNDKSPITSMVLNEDFDPDRDYVGDEILDSVPWEEVEAWANWTGADETPDSNGTAVYDEAAVEDEADIPF